MSDIELYLSGMSIPDIHKETGIPLSTLRFRLKKAGVLRGRAEAVRMAAKEGKLSSMKGKKRVFTGEWKRNISKSKIGKGVGVSRKPNGYIEITMGENKGRSVHVVLMEEKIGRRLYANECVHHINNMRDDNRIENLKLMTRSEHSKLHAKESHASKKRNQKGQYQ
jgi:hypothetical protein